MIHVTEVCMWGELVAKSFDWFFDFFLLLFHNMILSANRHLVFLIWQKINQGLFLSGYRSTYLNVLSYVCGKNTSEVIFKNGFFFPPYSMIKTLLNGCVYCLLALCLLLAPSAKYLYKTTMGAKIEKSVPNK